MHETVLKQLSFAWEGDQWWRIRFQAVPVASKKRLDYTKLWPKAQNEPKEWFLREEFDIEYMGASVPFGASPIQVHPSLSFDDIAVLSNQ